MSTDVTPVKSRIQKLATLPIMSLDPFAFGNPRSMQPKMKEVLRSSMREFGIVEPILVRPAKEKGRFEILNGHHRYDELKGLGETSVQAVVVDLPDDTKARALVLALNRIAADWDYTALTKYIDELMAADGSVATPQWLVDNTGFSATEIEQLAAAGSEFLNDITRQQKENGSAPAGDPDPDAAAGAGHVEYVTFSVPLTPEQSDLIHQAVKVAKKDDGASSNADALVTICRNYVEARKA